MELFLLRDYIGLYTPIILFVLSLFFLRNSPTFLRFFVSGFILNNILNIILKLFIKEPRPTNEQKALTNLECLLVTHKLVDFVWHLSP